MILLSQVKAAAVGTVWKTPRMHGYLIKEENSGGAEGSYKLKFVEKDPTKTHTYVVAADGSITAPAADTNTGPISVTGEFLELIMATWSTLTGNEASAAASTTGAW